MNKHQTSPIPSVHRWLEVISSLPSPDNCALGCQAPDDFFCTTRAESVQSVAASVIIGAMGNPLSAPHTAVWGPALAEEKDAAMSRTPQERPMIAETLRQAIADKEWTISQAAREADVDRTFLSRLLAGHPPPRARDGRRSAELDPRYSQIASALGLNPQTFLNQVRKEQELRSTSEGDDYAELLSRAMADIQRQYDPDTVAELNLVVRQLVPTMIDEGGPMELYRRLLGEPALARRRQGTNSGLNDANVNNHRGRDPLWVDDNLPTLCEALIELGYRCHTVQADVGLDVRFDLAAVLQKLGTREPAHIRRILGIDA